MASDNYMLNSHLPGNSFQLPGSEPACPLLHGFTATTAEVRLFAEHLNQTGFAVKAPLLAGHGTTPSDLNSTKWQNWFGSAETGFQELSKKYEQIIVAGESMGGLLAILLAAKYPQIKGLALFAPALKVRGLGSIRILQYFKPFWRKNLDFVEPNWKGYSVYPSKGLVQLHKLQHIALQTLPKVRQPMLLMMGGQDTSIDPKTAELIKNSAGTQDLHLVWVPDAPHLMLLSPQRDFVFQDVLNFIDSL
jgi:carboxylesterase